MNIIETFKIDENIFIEILIPDFEKKVNFYYEPSKFLHMFDQVSVIMKKNNEKFILFDDHINETIVTLKNSLQYALAAELLLPDSLVIGQVGYNYNINTYNDSEIYSYENFWLWSAKGIQSWMYNKDDKIYLEISPSYPWLYKKPKKDDNAISFEQFIKSYKPILVQEINRETAQKWLDKCNKILEKMAKP